MTSQELVSAIKSMPISATLALQFGACHADGAEVTMPVRSDFLQPAEQVHGGILTTLADTTAVYGIQSSLPDGWTLTSIELKLNFLRPARQADGPVSARSHIIKIGRTVALSDVELWQKDQLVAKGLFTYLVFEVKPG